MLSEKLAIFDVFKHGISKVWLKIIPIAGNWAKLEILEIVAFGEFEIIWFNSKLFLGWDRSHAVPLDASHPIYIPGLDHIKTIKFGWFIDSELWRYNILQEIFYISKFPKMYVYENSYYLTYIIGYIHNFLQNCQLDTKEMWWKINLVAIIFI